MIHQESLTNKQLILSYNLTIVITLLKFFDILCLLLTLAVCYTYNVLHGLAQRDMFLSYTTIDGIA